MTRTPRRLPRDPWPDATLPLLRDPYRYISRRARRLGCDAFRTRLMGSPAVCLTGAGPAALFYAAGPTRRKGAAPGLITGVLFGKDGIQTLDGPRHRHRKALYLQLTTGAGVDRLEEALAKAWEDALPEWKAAPGIDLFRATTHIVTAAVCAWAGVPLERHEVPRIADMLSTLFLTAGSLGPEHLRGRRARARADRWARGVVERARAGTADGGTAVSRLSAWTEPDGTLLPAEVAAVELLSLLRPTVAVAVYVTFLAMALHRHPGYREAVADDPALRHAFVQEVRRLSPFFPIVAAFADAPTEWRGAPIEAGARLVLDLYGTSRDPEAWSEADAFRPERFLGWQGNPWTPVPQGGGEHEITHRCPGEWFTIRLMEAFLARLAAARYRVLTPEAEPDYRQLPALPKGGFRISEFRPG